MMVYLALKLYDGSVVQRNDDAGTRWLARAPDAGNAVAMVHLGNSYDLGRGVDADPAVAQQWWHKALGSNDEAAIRLLREQGFVR